MDQRAELERILWAWDLHETEAHNSPIIDFACVLSRPEVSAPGSRFEVLDQLTKLESRLTHGSSIHELATAHISYAKELLGERARFEEYILTTQGCSTKGWSLEYLDYRRDLAVLALRDLGITWDSEALMRLRRLSEPIPPSEISSSIRWFASTYKSTVKELVDARAEFELKIETVRTDQYWAYWLDGMGYNLRLRINEERAVFNQTDAYRFALHEVLGHALQFANFTMRSESASSEQVRLLSLHTPFQCVSEGLAQVLPLAVAPEDPMVLAQTRLDHYTQLVRAEMHKMINTGWSAESCLEYALKRVPYYTAKEVADFIADRSANPQLRSYLWAYPAGIDWFLRIYEEDREKFVSALRRAYLRPTSPQDLERNTETGLRMGQE